MDSSSRLIGVLSARLHQTVFVVLPVTRARPFRPLFTDPRFIGNAEVAVTRTVSVPLYAYTQERLFAHGSLHRDASSSRRPTLVKAHFRAFESLASLHPFTATLASLLKPETSTLRLSGFVSLSDHGGKNLLHRATINFAIIRRILVAGQVRSFLTCLSACTRKSSTYAFQIYRIPKGERVPKCKDTRTLQDAVRVRI